MQLYYYSNSSFLEFNYVVYICFICIPYISAQYVIESITNEEFSICRLFLFQKSLVEVCSVSVYYGMCGCAAVQRVSCRSLR